MLDYGYRSKCCKAPIRLGDRKVKKTGQTVKVWVCCKCHSRDVDIVSVSDLQREVERNPFAE
jgi:hypothetical protein